MHYTKTILLPFVSVLLFTSCNSLFGGDNDNRICTSQFVQSTVIIAQEGSGQPVESVQITVKNQESGEELDICEAGTCSGNPEVRPGEYIIFHDGFQDDIDSGDEEVLVKGTKGDSISFTREYTFASDGCHIQKLAGPDTIFVSIPEG